MTEDPLQEIEEVTKSTNRMMQQKTRSVFKRYPITFSILILFGITSVLYGFEKLIDKISFLSNNPLFLLLVGLAILLLTGSLYKRLQYKK